MGGLLSGFAGKPENSGSHLLTVNQLIIFSAGFENDAD